MKTFARTLLSIALICCGSTLAVAGDLVLDVSDSWTKIEAGATVIDVRSAEEFASGHLRNAINIPHDQIDSRVQELGDNKQKAIILYCKSGRRAGLAQESLKAHGFTNSNNAGAYNSLAEQKR